MNALPVAIAGGGIAGLCAALALSRAGHEVLVFEREASRTGAGAGLQISPNASRHLRAWGVLDRLDATALAPRAVVVRRGVDAKPLATLDLSDAERRWGAPFRLAHRADLHAALMDAVSAAAQITIHAGVAVTGWREEAVLVVETASGEHAANALIIADGVHSPLREKVEPGPLKPSGRVAWRALVPAEVCPDFAREPVSNLWLGPQAHLVHYPLRGGSVVNVVAIVADNATSSVVEPANLRGLSHSGAADTAFWSRPGESAELAARFREWSDSAQLLLGTVERWRVWPLFSRDAPARLTKGRVALMGDSAHPMMPFLAQGAAQAIEDAAALGAASANFTETTSALKAYERARLSRVRRVLTASERQAIIYHMHGASAAARDFAMRATGSLGLRAATGWIYRG